MVFRHQLFKYQLFRRRIIELLISLLLVSFVWGWIWFNEIKNLNNISYIGGACILAFLYGTIVDFFKSIRFLWIAVTSKTVSGVEFSCEVSKEKIVNTYAIPKAIEGNYFIFFESNRNCIVGEIAIASTVRGASVEARVRLNPSLRKWSKTFNSSPVEITSGKSTDCEVQVSLDLQIHNRNKRGKERVLILAI